MNRLSVAVIGAGMGGLAAAAALRRAVIAVTIYEQAHRFARVGAGIQIGCNAMNVLRGFGLEAALRDWVYGYKAWTAPLAEHRLAKEENRAHDD
jgi:6-hydroxynicotinate 3-monooxygenase